MSGLLLATGRGAGTTFGETTRPPNLTPFNPLFADLRLQPRSFVLDTPVGPIRLELLPAASIAPLAPREPGDPRALFRPPTFFSAPLPTGSGARALGFSGAFTAISDDATAASWNPAGLLRLETPEASVVFRHSLWRNHHESSDPDFTPAPSEYTGDGVNYASLVIPLALVPSGRRFVVSLNHQEAWDFAHSFSARAGARASVQARERRAGESTGIQEDRFSFEDGRFDVIVRSTVTTRSESVLRQTTLTELDSRLRFDQSGVIEASSPALAWEVTPTLSLGAALNFHQDSPWPDRGIQSSTRVDYSARQVTRARVTNRQVTQATFETSVVEHAPGFPPFVPPFDVELASERGAFPAFRDEQKRDESSTRVVSGTYEQTDRTDDLFGANATLGLLWTLNRFLVLGAAVDLPWTADASQTRQIRHTRREDGAPAQVTESTEQRPVSFDFPLFANAGAVVRLSDRLYASLDAGFTRWSDFAFDAGEGRLNPLDGTPHGENPVGDTLSWHGGLEYLLITRGNEIPLRIGGMRQERPALGTPDVYGGMSLGTGISLGRDPGKIILDVAGQYLEARDVQSVIPERAGLRTSTRQYQFFVSLVWHF